MKKLFNVMAIMVVATMMASCGFGKSVTTTPTLPSGMLNLAITENPTPDKYANMDYGIRLNVADARAKI